jgi:hypothetical protein
MHQKSQPFLDGFSIAGYSCVPLTPFYMKDLDRFDSPAWTPLEYPRRCKVSEKGEVREVALEEIRRRPTIQEELGRLSTMSDPARTVYVVHTPPAGTKLDLLHDGTHIGSPALREFIETHKPPLTLHGHIHESPEISGEISDRIGPTFSVNPGASLHYLQAVSFDLDNPSRTLKQL